MHIYVRRGGPNYQTGLAKMQAVGEELGVPVEVNHFWFADEFVHFFKGFFRHGS